MTKLILFLFFILSWGFAQTYGNTFSYTVEADQNHTVTDATSNAVAGAFYADERYNVGEGNESWQIILGIRGGEDYLTEKLRIVVPFPTNGEVLPAQAVAFYESLDGMELDGSRWTRVDSDYSKLDITFTESRVEGSFEFSLSEKTCLSGSLSTDLRIEQPELHVAVSNGKPRVPANAPTEREAYNDSSFLRKDSVDRGGIVWGGYEYMIPSPLFGAPDEPKPIDVCS